MVIRLVEAYFSTHTGPFRVHGYSVKFFSLVVSLNCINLLNYAGTLGRMTLVVGAMSCHDFIIQVTFRYFNKYTGIISHWEKCTNTIENWHSKVLTRVYWPIKLLTEICRQRKAPQEGNWQSKLLTGLCADTIRHGQKSTHTVRYWHDFTYKIMYWHECIDILR